ncbi:putative beta-phosphoglucomutase [Nitrospira sp. KM1]|uniref:HAD family hydrolase n=1 Tax=Nitrospira sp. KM1 TaxID=1936990 RepID=UPI0013A71B85|nr:HAD family hydrolase [Nitrospira sp. KM1]BCA54521.1 putative beta-phosphoglucomutase [Nitrospira sp. KM1]
MSELILFDCDGVLIDSEIIANRIEAEELARLGYAITMEEIINRFTGISEQEASKLMRKEYGFLLPENHAARVTELILKEFHASLQPIDGIRETLSALSLPRCVASSSNIDKIRLGLTTTGLIEYFDPRYLFSASMVECGKPAPDLFLLAAGKMGYAPEQCVVIEDSVPGVQAAKAAGMRVFGFSGGTHCNTNHQERLKDHGADLVFADMRRLNNLLAS